MVGGFLLLSLFKPEKKDVEAKRDISFSYILTTKQFYLYFVAWFIFSFIDSLEVSILRPFLQDVFGESFKVFMLDLNALIMAFSIFIVGFLIDFYGRKRALIYGFTALGIAYACIGIDPYNIIYLLVLLLPDIRDCCRIFRCNLCFYNMGRHFTKGNEREILCYWKFPVFLYGFCS